MRLPFNGDSLRITAMKNAPPSWSWGTILMQRRRGNFEPKLWAQLLLEMPPVSQLTLFVSSMLKFLDKGTLYSELTSKLLYTVWLSWMLVLEGNMLGHITFFLLSGTSSWVWNQDPLSFTCKSHEGNHWGKQIGRATFWHLISSMQYCPVLSNCSTEHQTEKGWIR